MIRSRTRARLMMLVATSLAVAPAAAQRGLPVNAITPPKVPLPAEGASAGINRFSFIAYGDTRGRHDSAQVQSEHQLVIEQMLATIRSRAAGPNSIRFVLQSGDAVVKFSLSRHGPARQQRREML